MTTESNVSYCLDCCGNVLSTVHELEGGICMQCLNGVTFSDWGTSIWETEPTAPWEDEDGIDADEKLCILINEGLASIWPSPVFEGEDEPNGSDHGAWINVGIAMPGMVIVILNQGITIDHIPNEIKPLELEPDYLTADGYEDGEDPWDE